MRLPKRDAPGTNRLIWPTYTICLAAMFAAATGCQSAAYQASSLPKQLIAPQTVGLQRVDLSGLARTVSNSNIIYPGDLLEITIATGLEEDTPPAYPVRIGSDGNADVPLVGQIPLAGLEISHAEQAIASEGVRRGLYVDPNVTVAVKERKSHRVTVVGAVDKPGTYELPSSSCDVLSAIVRAGGLTEEAGTVLEIRHPPNSVMAGKNHAPTDPAVQLAGFNGSTGVNGPSAINGPGNPDHLRTLRIDLKQRPAFESADLTLPDGSTVMVMQKPKRFVNIMGLVKEAGQFEMPEDTDLRLLDAIAMAGGRTLSFADKVHVVRTVEGHSEPVIIEASVRAAMRSGSANIRLAAGDLVSVEETPTTFVVGTIREFVRFGFTAGIPGF